jgi:hypothetical protein
VTTEVVIMRSPPVIVTTALVTMGDAFVGVTKRLARRGKVRNSAITRCLRKLLPSTPRA